MKPIGLPLRRAPITLGITLLILGLYLFQGPVSGSANLQSFPDHLTAVLRHGSLQHLLVNAVIIALAGWQAEPRLGAFGTLGLILTCALLGSAAEYILAGPGFAGISGPAYGLGTYAVLALARPEHRAWLALGAAALLAAELHFGQNTLAIYSHAVSAALGGALIMLKGLFGSKSPGLHPMALNQISRVVEIIAQTDEDDAAEAEELFLDRGVANMFVLKQGRDIIGVTGFSLDEEAQGVAWLSWTYLDQAHAGQGLGRQMMDELLSKLTAAGLRRLFIETSDYEEDGEKIYAAAHAMYEGFGADLEVTMPDYHTPGEAKLIYALINHDQEAPPMPELDGPTGIRITGAEKAPEGDKVAGLTWSQSGTGIEGLENWLSDSAANGARMAVIVLPSDLSHVNQEALKTQGFKSCGSLTDFYSFGLHQEWWACSLPTD